MNTKEEGARWWFVIRIMAKVKWNSILQRAGLKRVGNPKHKEFIVDFVERNMYGDRLQGEDFVNRFVEEFDALFPGERR